MPHFCTPANHPFGDNLPVFKIGPGDSIVPRCVLLCPVARGASMPPEGTKAFVVDGGAPQDRQRIRRIGHCIYSTTLGFLACEREHVLLQSVLMGRTARQSHPYLRCTQLDFAGASIIWPVGQAAETPGANAPEVPWKANKQHDYCIQVP
jgi:hypothetical protein